MGAIDFAANLCCPWHRSRRRVDALTAFAYAPIAIALRGGTAPIAFAQFWRHGLAGNLAAFIGYVIVVWEMTQAPVAAVALRETSVVFATLIGVALLGEPSRAQRALASLIILAGDVPVRLG